MLFRICFLGLLLTHFACAQKQRVIKEVTRPTLSSYTRQYLKFEHTHVAFEGCQIIDGTGRVPKKKQTLLISGDKIVGIGHMDSIDIPQGFHVIPAKGKTIIPGIIGTHNHLRLPQGPLFFTGPRMYLACGVTTIQTCGTGDPDIEIQIGEASRKGSIPGPDMLHSGPYFTGPDGRDNFIRVTNEQKTRELIQYWAGQGVSWFKVYQETRPRDLAIIIDEAHTQGAKVTGHLCATTFQEAAALGIDAVEHGFLQSADHIQGRAVGECSSNRSFRSELIINSKEVRKVQQSLIDNQVALSSTPSIMEAQASVLADARDLAAMSADHVRQYINRKQRKDSQGADWYFKDGWLSKSLAYDLAFYQAGGLLTAGPDPGLHNMPGYGDQKNYELFVRGGFQPEEAIQVMTSNGAKLLEIQDKGKITIGFVADLIVLDGDLVKDPKVIRKVAMVFKDGWAYDPAPLLDSVAGLVGSDKDEIVFLGE